jgi:hypothetical protein
MVELLVLTVVRFLLKQLLVSGVQGPLMIAVCFPHEMQTTPGYDAIE